MTLPRRATISDVARRAGVSSTAVSFVFNGRSGLSEDTRARILEAAAFFDWVPNVRAQALSHGRARTIGLVAQRGRARPAGIGLLDLVAGISRALAQEGYALVFDVVEGRREEVAAYRRLSRESRIDGVLLLDAEPDDNRLVELGALGLRSVVLGREAVGNANIASVSTGIREAEREAFRFLARLGHRRIAYMTEASCQAGTLGRAPGWHEDCLRLGVEPVPTRTSESESAVSRETLRLLRLTRRPTAILYGDDGMAEVGASVAVDRGFHVPADLSIVGIGDGGTTVRGIPPLTSVRLDGEAAAAVAVSTLIALVEGRKPPEAWTAVVSVVIRRSAGAPPRRVRPLRASDTAEEDVL